MFTNKVLINVQTILLLIFLFHSTLKAGDTIRIMHYNLLNYANSTTYCDQTNNNLQNKETAISAILEYNMPDIFTVNEVAANQITANRLFGIVNNANSKTYRMSSYSNLSSSDLVNLIFYNSEKLTLYKQRNIATSVRDFIAITLFYNSIDLISGDTAFITCITGHLKAGDSQSDAAARSQMINVLNDYLANNNYSGNITLSGDFNIYSSSEACYQSLINNTNNNIRFYDPVNKPGNWHSNSTYAVYHTQSTHSSSNGCASGGGFDDRFDFILATAPLLNGSQKMEIISGSYKAFGQNGTAYNGSILNMSNNLPYNINQALYTVSDHLPVMMDIKIYQTHVGIDKSENIIYLYTDQQNQLHIKLPDLLLSDLQLKIINPLGKLRYANSLRFSTENEYIIPLSLQSGLYIVIINYNQSTIAKKIFIH